MENEAVRPKLKEWLTSPRIEDFLEAHIDQANGHNLSPTEIYNLCRQAQHALKLEAYCDQLEAHPTPAKEPSGEFGKAVEELAEKADTLTRDYENEDDEGDIDLLTLALNIDNLNKALTALKSLSAERPE